MCKHPNTYELEEMIHQNFEGKEMIHEWFDLNDDDMHTIFNTLRDFREEGIFLTRVKPQIELDL